MPPARRIGCAPRDRRCHHGGVDIRFQVVVFDAADLDAESSFWAGVFDGTVDVDDGWHMVLVDGEPRIGVQLAPDHVPPNWPVERSGAPAATEG